LNYKNEHPGVDKQYTSSHRNSDEVKVLPGMKSKTYTKVYITVPTSISLDNNSRIHNMVAHYQIMTKKLCCDKAWLSILKSCISI